MSERRGTRLSEYRRKRDFKKTPEPSGASNPRAGAQRLEFVVQKHAASHLHFDFRLELDGAMKSWAVPKGPSYDPSVKRLAMQVEDHPIEYNRFEGTIPQGEYGGGTVMIWDRGTYTAEDGGGAESLRAGYDRGDLKILLSGKRLRGSWVLVRLKRTARPDRPQWLLIKHRDAQADPERDIVATAKTSVVTGRTMEQIAAGKPARKPRRKAARKPGPTSARKPAPKPARKRKPAAKTARASRTRASNVRERPASASRRTPPSPPKRRSSRSRS